MKFVVVEEKSVHCFSDAELASFLDVTRNQTKRFCVYTLGELIMDFSTNSIQEKLKQM